MNFTISCVNATGKYFLLNSKTHQTPHTMHAGITAAMNIIPTTDKKGVSYSNCKPSSKFSVNNGNNQFVDSRAINLIISAYLHALSLEKTWKIYVWTILHSYRIEELFIPFEVIQSMGNIIDHQTMLGKMCLLINDR